MPSVHHISLPDLMVSYSGGTRLETLSVGTRLEAQPILFLWRDDTPARAEEVLRDPHYNVETTRLVPLASFPTATVIKRIRENPAEFPKDIGVQIIHLLETNRG